MTKVNRNEKIWAYAGNGTKAHAFIELDNPAVPDVFRAMCRESLKHTGQSTLVGQRSVKDGLCRNCLNRAEDMWWSVETSGEIQNAATPTPAAAETDGVTDAELLAENAERALNLITKNAADRHEAAERIDAFVQGFPDLAAAIGVKRATLLPEVAGPMILKPGPNGEQRLGKDYGKRSFYRSDGLAEWLTKLIAELTPSGEVTQPGI